MDYALEAMMESDEDLMLSYSQGNIHAFETLYSRHKDSLYRFLLRQCGHTATAEELFQDVWMNLIRSRENYRVQATFRTFLYHMAHNRLIDHYRRKKTGIPVSYQSDSAPDLDEISDCPQQNPEVQAQNQQLHTMVHAAIQELPEAQREAFLLHEEGGLSLNQIAEINGVNPETIKSRIRYAIRKLKQSLGDVL